MHSTRRVFAALISLATISRPGSSQQGAPPPDRAFHTDSAALACLDRAIQPRVAEARRTFPEAQRHFVTGLPPGHSLSVTTRLRDTTGHFEQVFVTVDSVRGDSLFGRIASELDAVQGFRYGQLLIVNMRDLLDWTILRPDGSEEGNFVGKYLDSLQDQLQRHGIPKPC